MDWVDICKTFPNDVLEIDVDPDGVCHGGDPVILINLLKAPAPREWLGDVMGHEECP